MDEVESGVGRFGRIRIRVRQSAARAISNIRRRSGRISVRKTSEQAAVPGADASEKPSPEKKTKDSDAESAVNEDTASKGSDSTTSSERAAYMKTMEELHSFEEKNSEEKKPKSRWQTFKAMFCCCASKVEPSIGPKQAQRSSRLNYIVPSDCSVELQDKRLSKLVLTEAITGPSGATSDSSINAEGGACLKPRGASSIVLNFLDFGNGTEKTVDEKVKVIYVKEADNSSE